MTLGGATLHMHRPRMLLARLDDGPEIFHTLQGEGISAGVPAVFIRSALCNLHCHWCDTDHTWNFEGTPWAHIKDADPGYRKHRKADVTLELSPVQIADRVSAFPCRRAVLTGGEPLLQQEAWLGVIEALRARDPSWTFEVETNGTKLPTEAFRAAVDQFNVSPKLANSRIEARLRTIPTVLAAFATEPKAWFKFVARNKTDLDEVADFAATHNLPASRVLVMPEGRSAAELDRHSPALIDRCLAEGWRFSDRLHVRLWGDRRGV